MNIEQYLESGRWMYQEFSIVVKGIIDSIINNDPNRYGVQQVQQRAKSVSSLSKKLKDRGIYHSEDIEKLIKDLAGCRIIFYHNEDLNVFLSSGNISDNFEVDWDESKVHHPMADAKSANDYYMANHYLISLKSDRLALPEFSKFAGLKCEIQIQTLLNHAWAETVHNISYKRPKSTGFGDRLMAKIDERLKLIMTNYLRPAGYEFQKVKYDYNQIYKGQEVFDSGVKEGIEAVRDNNAIYDLLQRYKDYVLPNYSDYPSNADEIYEIISISLSRGRDLGVVDRETPFGSFPGKSYKEVLSLCLDILSYIRYLDLERTQLLFVSIYSKHINPTEQEIYATHVENFAGYDFEMVTSNGLQVQEQILRNLLGKSQEDLLAISGYVISVCKAFLKPSFQKTTWTSDQVSIKSINLNGNDELKVIRQGAIELMKTLFFSEDVSIKASVLDCLNSATAIPHLGNFTDELLNIILSNSNEVVRVYVDDIERQSFHDIEAYEERLLSWYRHAREIMGNEGKSLETRQLAQIMVDSIIEYRDRVNSIEDFIKYKVLVGFRAVFEKEWDEEAWSRENKEAYRVEKISDFVNSINNENLEQWVRVFSKCVRADSTDRATFRYFGNFLRLLATKKPELSSKLLRREDSGLAPFLASILLGLADAERFDILDTIVTECIARGERLWECGRLYVLNPKVNRANLPRLFEASKQKNDVPAMIQILAAAIVNIENIEDELSTLFLPIIQELTSRGHPNWIHETYFRDETSILLSSINAPEAKIILDNLLLLPEIDYDAELVIRPIAIKYPILVIEYFGLRLEKEKQKERNARYEAIPYKFQLLADSLSEMPADLVDIILNWFNADPTLFEDRGAKLISNIFPNFSGRLETKLINLIDTGVEQTFDFITSILANYEGETFLHEVCKKLIKALPINSEHSTRLMIILQSSEVLHGEFGFVEHYERKKTEIIHWLNDEDPKIKSFADSYVKWLDRQIASEQRRGEEAIEMRRHQFE